MSSSADFSAIASDLADESTVFLDLDIGPQKEKILNYLIAKAVETGRATDSNGIVAAALEREEKAPTGLPGGIAIPHCRHEDWSKPTLMFARLTSATEFTTPDGPADLLFFIGVPSNNSDVHVDILAALAKALRDKGFRAALRGAEGDEEAARIISEHITKAPRRKAKKPPTKTNIVAITACPTGIAHTYLAAEALTGAAESMADLTLTVETQGSAGTQEAPAEAVTRADVLVIAADIGVTGLKRFSDKPQLKVPIRKAANEPAEVLQQAKEMAEQSRVRAYDRKAPKPKEDNDQDSPPQPGNSGTATATESAQTASEEWARGSSLSGQKSIGHWVRDAIMTGVSYMVPFVAASGLLIALGFLVGGHQVGAVADAVTRDLRLPEIIGLDAPIAVPTQDLGTVLVDRSGLWLYLGSALFAIGNHGMQVIVAVMSAYIAFGMAGRAGIAPGFIGGAIAVTVGAGFLGGLVTGILAGLVVALLLRLKVPDWLRPLMPVVVIPMLGAMSVGLTMYLLLGMPLAWLMTALQQWLQSLDTTAAFLFGGLLGAMMCVDMGGMINKAAYLFAVANIASADPASWKVMAAVMAAGMVPPLATSLAVVLRPKLFSSAERQNGKAGWVLGAAFISEGVIPFAAADPLRVIPSIVIGGAVTGGTSMALGAATRVPHGGIFVLFAIDNPVAWLTAIVLGSIVAAILVVAAKSLWPRQVSTDNQNLEADVSAEA
ncbi:fructose-specific PTS transporter subunit EIIC [Corynebacterium sp. 5QC2CO]|uniref:PTS fructose transporter subunit IIABC n=1 Tax=Corynebacterium sp. 5QC2CO TaxID=2968468 RepID=UPI00211C5EE7|nr:fructose-specific PTS transporter subunit EIIC [Corynebacterium sp. 5QC2CO]MCQ9349996.1 fructose-specific PTS transporter subunit EIIC [Corynebacterium sp. 5QC2CO]